MESLVLLVLLGAAFWLLVLRPTRRQRAAAEAIQAALEPGARVVTVGGMRATVVAVLEDDVVLEVAEGVHVRFVRGALRSVEPSGTADRDDPAEPSSADDQTP